MDWKIKIIELLKKFWQEFSYYFSDEEDPNEPIYDPAHFASMIILVIFIIGILFWLLWTLLVFEGGIFKKIIPSLEVAFTSKTLQDFGWLGYPYEMGIFSGFIGNGAALILTIAFVVGIWWVFKDLPKLKEREENKKNGI
ncbi:MAG: hypothetical protein A3I11_00970 [Elusimicrobia bacterium RIFCSPLOWO2_02_FULL_39_32]|nr:MAG: hypothetical protein A2034_07300 [Elusimicrobia bacterium GWA2_38_7]OGR79012.1 MAG: hypothetical protein A3B80_07995 [Elusimicrobia bacterium RIFCSPHIGHO2_02_FULL_39_36]OGR92596.1 MAG: hypothetical protein A3I11_00970 [Elusimicrobia bacterium RIFCSPLOWO2_02_FULL_39_32]OGR99243.1 MAG: hypothetical protein A3G85_06180 [Elusimicrobia bacterium RIFCSPLOWO2_12_FULL_39_28]